MLAFLQVNTFKLDGKRARRQARPQDVFQRFPLVQRAALVALCCSTMNILTIRQVLQRVVLPVV